MFKSNILSLWFNSKVKLTAEKELEIFQKFFITQNNNSITINTWNVEHMYNAERKVASQKIIAVSFPLSGAQYTHQHTLIAARKQDFCTFLILQTVSKPSTRWSFGGCCWMGQLAAGTML